MFEYLNKGSSSSRVDLELLGEFAKSAASQYLGPSKVPLQESITKIASSEALNPDQVALVCHEANKSVHEAIFNQSDNKYVTFDVADPRVIVGLCEDSHEKVANHGRDVIEKTASIYNDTRNLDYEMLPSELGSTGDYVVAGNRGHQGLSDNSKYFEKKAHENYKMAMDKVASREVMLEAQGESYAKRFIKEARAHLIMYPLTYREEQYENIASFCKSAGLSDDKTDSLMGLLNKVMIAQGLIEKTAAPAPVSLISKNLKAQVANGDHPLESIVHLIDNNESDRVRNEKEKSNLVQTELKPMRHNGHPKQTIRPLE